MSGTPSAFNEGWYITFQTAVIKQLPRPDQIDQVTAESWEKNQQALKGVLAQVLLPPQPIEPPIKGTLLLFESEKTVECGAKKFVARNRFKKNVGEDAELKISDWGSNFGNWFLPKAEDSIGRQDLLVNRLLKYAKDEQIIQELGGESKVQITLQEKFAFLKTADKNLWYVSYIEDASGVLRAVRADWGGGGWYFGALPVGYGWDADSRFLSRKPSGV